MGIDKFSVSGTHTINRGKETALSSLIRTVGLIVGEESPTSPDQFEEDLKEKLSFVEVNGKVLWNLAQDVTTINEGGIEEWSPASKKKLKDAKRSFKDFTDKPFSSSPKVERPIYGLNRDVLRSAAWEMLSTHYQLYGKSFHFTIDMPPSENAVLKLKREDKEEGCTLGLEFSASVYEAFDYNKGRLFGLNRQGKLQVIKEENYAESLSEENWQKICEIQLQVTIFLANVPDPKPEVTVEITVGSTCPQFRYCGGWALEILQLENVDLEPEKPLLTTPPASPSLKEYIGARKIPFSMPTSPDITFQDLEEADSDFSESSLRSRSSFDRPAKPAKGFTERAIEDPLIGLLEVSNRKIGIMIERIVSARNSSLDTPQAINQLLLPILHLFNETLKACLIKEESTYEYFNSHGIQATEFKLRSDLVNMIKEQDIPAKALIQLTQKELCLIFNKLYDSQLSPLLKLFHTNMLSKMQEAALFICKHPQHFLDKHGYIVHANKLRHINYSIAVAIQSIRLALNAIKREKKIEMVGIEQTVVPIMEFNDVPLAFQNYITSLISSQSNDNPLRHLIIVYMNVTELLQDAALENFPEEDFAGPSEGAENQHQEYRLLHLQLPAAKKRLSCCPSGEPEKIAALWERNPIIKGINQGSAIYFALRQLLSVYPDIRVSVLPYLTLVNIAGGMVGMAIGTHAILHPKRTPNAFVRIWEATADGLVVCVFSMGTAITVYLAIHPENTHVPNRVFWTQIASVPVILSGAHALWHSIPRTVKDRWFSANRLRYYSRKGLEVTANFLLYAGALDIALLNLARLPHNLIYQIIPPVVGLFLALGHLTPFKERINLGMIYLTAIDFCYMLAETMLSEEVAPEWSYIQMGFWILMLIPSVIFTLRNTANFVETYEQPPEMIVRAAPRTWDPEAALTINADQFHSLRQLPSVEDAREQAKLLTFARQIHNQTYGATEPLLSSEATLTPTKDDKRPKLGLLDCLSFT